MASRNTKGPRLHLHITLTFVWLCAMSVAIPTGISLDIGPNQLISNTKPVFNLGLISPVNTNNISLNVFQTAREGELFEVILSLPAGTYDLDLGFVETQSCSNAARVFHIFVNGEIMRESFDVYKVAKGCNRAYITSIPNLSISPLHVNPVVLKFVSVSGLATLSYIRVTPSKEQCIPVTKTARINEPHLAHSLPGVYNTVVDRDGDKYEFVTLDGRESHSHFSYSGGSGRIISYEWSIVETGKIISTKPTFRYRFPLGTTRVRLTVTDNVCSQHRDDTTITVTKSSLRGQYCYFYPLNDSSKSLRPQTLLNNPPPASSSASVSAKTRFPAFHLLKNKFVARCMFFVQFDKSSEFSKFSINTGESGTARVFKGKDIVLDSATSSTSKGEKVRQGMQEFEVIYARTNVNKPAMLDFKVDGKLPLQIFYDRSNILPIITKIDPTSGSLGGGANVHIHGFGLHLPLKVWFDEKAAFAKKTGHSEWQASVTAPSGIQPGKVFVQVESADGTRSNAVTYEYGNSCDDVLFDSSKMSNLAINQPTAVALANDNRLYIGTRLGNIQVVTYNSVDLKATHTCSSEQYRDSRYRTANGALSRREILGITFDPRDKVPHPYVSMNTLFWGGKSKSIDPNNTRAWSNGAIERFKPASQETLERNPNQCLEHDRNIVRNLPVSFGDHGVNELLFNQNGDLLITVGGNTNMGLPGGRFGGLWESYFSASVVVARLSRGAKFNGEIPYTTPDRLDTARPKPGYTDVDLYATGFRNLFSLSMARNGRIYGVDMGPNNHYGNASITCSEYNEATGNSRIDSIPGRVIIDPFRKGEAKYGPARGDKLVEVKPGKFYGHANIQRAVMTNKMGECAWIDPLTGKRAGGGAAPSNYEHCLSYFTSAETGIQEYGSDHFCGKLRGDLIMSKNSGLGSLRVRMEKGRQGKVSGVPHKFVPQSGIRVAENVGGDLLFPQYKSNSGILVHRPRVKSRSALSITNALPFRHGRQGGTPLTIGGFGFKQGVLVSVGGKNCPVTRVSAIEIECTVPAMQGGSHVSVTLTMENQKSTLDRAVLYMMV